MTFPWSHPHFCNNTLNWCDEIGTKHLEIKSMTGRERLESIISSCAALQNVSDEFLEPFADTELKQADDILDNLVDMLPDE